MMLRSAEIGAKQIGSACNEGHSSTGVIPYDSSRVVEQLDRQGGGIPVIPHGWISSVDADSHHGSGSYFIDVHLHYLWALAWKRSLKLPLRVEPLGFGGATWNKTGPKPPGWV
jgi:hypothetical protein